MNTLTNERLKELTRQGAEDDTPLCASSIEVRELAERLLSAEAQLAELRGQEPIAYIISDKYNRRGDLTRRSAESIYSAEEIAEHEIACPPLFARPVPPAASQPTCDVWKWCCEYQYNKDWPALDYDIFDHQHEAEEKARDTEGNVFPIYKSIQETQVDFLPKNLDRALTIMGMAIPESKEEFNFQSERWIQRLINAVLRMGKQSQPVLSDVIEKFSEMNIGFPVQKLKADYVISWVLNNYPCDIKSQPYMVPDEMAVTDEMTVTAQMFARGHNACRAAMLQSGNSNVWVKGRFAYDTLFNAIGKAVNIQGDALSISVKAFEEAMLAAAPQHQSSIEDSKQCPSRGN